MNDNELIELTQSLIKIPSLTGGELELAKFAQKYLEEAGFKTFIDEFNSIIAVYDFGGEGPTVLLDSHIDTVDINKEKWTHDPFGGEIEDGKIYGRGTSDMKGAFAAIMYAGKSLINNKNRVLKGKIVITGSTWEEYFEGYALKHILNNLKKIKAYPAYVIIGEASDLNIKRGQRGRTRINIEIEGKPAHTAHPYMGINAINNASELINYINKNKDNTQDNFLGGKVTELIGIDSKPNPIDSVVPYKCKLTYDLRILPSDSKKSILDNFNNYIKEVKKQNAQFEAKVEFYKDQIQSKSFGKIDVETFAGAWKLPEDHELVQRSAKALKKSGIKTKLTKYDFCTNGSFTAGEAGIPTIGFGPGQENIAHIDDEYIEIEQLTKATIGYSSILKEILK